MRRSDMTPAEKLDRDLAVARSARQVPRAERKGQISPTREIVCRCCPGVRWMTHGDGTWRHQDDGSPATIDPATMKVIDPGS